MTSCTAVSHVEKWKALNFKNITLLQLVFKNNSNCVKADRNRLKRSGFLRIFFKVVFFTMTSGESSSLSSQMTREATSSVPLEEPIKPDKIELCEPVFEARFQLSSNSSESKTNEPLLQTRAISLPWLQYDLCICLANEKRHSLNFSALEFLLSCFLEQRDKIRKEIRSCQSDVAYNSVEGSQGLVK